MLCGQMHKSAIAPSHGSVVHDAHASVLVESRSLEPWDDENVNKKRTTDLGDQRGIEFRVVSFGLRSKNIPKLPSENIRSEACAALSLVLSLGNLWDLCPAMDAGLSQFGGVVLL